MNTEYKKSRHGRRLTTTFVNIAIVLAVLLAAPTALAQGGGTIENGCMRDNAGFNLNCTANDINLADATVVVKDDGCQYPGDTVTVDLWADVLLTAQARHDIGVYLATDGGDALTGECVIGWLPYAPDPPYVDLDGVELGRCEFDDTISCVKNQDCPEGTGTCIGYQDLCGDIDAAHSPINHYFGEITFTCIDTDGDGLLDVPTCTSWRQPGDNDLCLEGQDAVPGAPSKCKCASTTLPVPVPKVLEVVKSLDPPDGSGLFDLQIDGTTYAAGVGDGGTTGKQDVSSGFCSVTTGQACSQNTDCPVEGEYCDPTDPTVGELGSGGTDLTFYDTSIECLSDDGAGDIVASCDDCTSLEVPVGPSQTDIVCTITNVLILFPPDLTVVKSNDADDDGTFNDTETVPVDAIYPVTVPYQVEITNSSASDATIDSIVDGTHDITGSSCDALIGTPILAGETLTCTFDVVFDNADAGSVTNLITATASNDAGSDEASDDSTVNFEADPDIALVKAGAIDLGADLTATPGDIISYTFDVTNTGNVTLTNVDVTDPLVTNIDCGGTTNVIGAMAPDGTAQCTGTYAITQADIDAGLVFNTATAAGDCPDGTVDCATATDDHSEPLGQTPALALTKTLNSNADEDGNGEVSLNDTLTYEFVATNTGNQTLTGVTIVDPLPGLSALTCDQAQPATLAPGAALTCTATYVVTQADVDAGVINNTSIADSNETEEVPDDETVPVPRYPALGNAKSLQSNADEDGNGEVSLNDTLTYEFVATNTGNQTLTGVTIVDPLPGLSALTCDQAQPATLAPGAALTCTATYVVTQADVDAGVINNTSIADSNETEEVPDDETVPVPRYPALGNAKSLQSNADEDGNGEVSLNDTLTYEFVATNTGNQTLTGVTIVDPLPGLSALTCDQAQPATLAPGAALTCTATYVVTQADVDAGVINNTSIADSNETEEVPDDETVPVPRYPALGNAKSLQSNADEDGNGEVSLNDTLTYEFVATNTGNQTLTGVTIVDPLPGLSALTCDQAQPATLAPGAALTCTATYVVTQADVDAGVINNTSIADSNETEEVPDDETVPVPRYPALGNAKSLQSNADEDGNGEVSLNDTLTYEFVATNTGNQTLTGVTIVDPLPGLSALTCDQAQPATLAPGAALTCTATYVVTQADVDAGVINNTSIADSNETEEVPDDETVPVPRYPALGNAKSLQSNADEDGNGEVSLNDTLTYEFVATNTGNQTLTGVTIVDPLPGLSALTCDQAQPATLAPGAALTCTATYVVTQADVDAGVINNTSIADSNETEEVPDDETVPVPRYPALGNAKSLQSNADEDGNGEVSLNDTLTYEFVATNTGNQTLTGVTIVDPLPGLSALTCDQAQPATLAPGAALTCTATYVVTQADVDAGVINNTSIADSNETEEVPDDETVPVPRYPALGNAKSLQSNADEDGNGEVSLNDTLTYEFVATNTGNQTLTGVTIVDPLPGLSALTCDQAQPATLAPGAALTCTATYVVTQADVDAGVINNTSIADSNETEEVPDDETVPVPRYPALGNAKSLQSNADEDGNGEVSLNDTLTYEFVATNTGNQTLTGVTIVDPLPGLSALTCDQAQPATLAPGAALTCTATYVVTQADVDAGVINNTSIADSNETEEVPDDETVPVPRYPALGNAKSLQSNADEDGNGEVSLNDTLTYEFVATNTGNQTLTGVTIVDPLPGLSALTCDQAQPATLAPGAALTCTATYVVTQADVDAGVINNTSIADSNETEEVPDDETVPVPRYPALGNAKSLQSNADEDGNGEVSLNDTLTYEFVATNTGNQTLTGVTIVDPLPGLSALTCDQAQPATLAPGAALTCTATYVVTQADVDAGVINNTSIADSNETEEVPDDETVPVPRYPALGNAKSLQSNADEDGNGEVSLNDTLTYEFVATNTGNQTLTGVTIVDPLPGLSALTCDQAQPATLAPGAALTCTATYVVTQADVDAGVINNTSIADSNETEEVPDDETVPVPRYPALGNAKSLQSNADEDGNGEVSLNDTLTYEFVATNTGNQTLTGVTIVDPLPGLSALTCDQAQPATLAPGAALTCTATYVVTQADVDAGVINNTSIADSNETEEVPDDETVPVPRYPALGNAKSLQSNADEDGNGEVSLNDTLTYEFVATNTGNQTLTGVTIVDPLPGLSALTCDQAQPATLAPGAALTCTATYVVTQADVDAGVINNTSIADSNETEEVPDDETVPVPRYPALGNAKSLQSNADEDGNGEVSLNDTLTYEFVATNTGNQTLTGVTIVDPLPGLSALTCDQAQPATLAPGAALTCTATYVVTQADVDAGVINNTSIADSNETEEVPDDETVPVPRYPALGNAKSLQSNADEDGNGEVSLNDTLTYEFVATNTGNQTLTGVTIVDPLPGLSALTCDQAQPATLAPGAALTCTATYVVTQADVDAGVINNTSIADSNETEEVPDDETVPVLQHPVIEIIKSADQTLILESFSGNINYEFKVTNKGNVTLTNVTVTDPLPNLSEIDCGTFDGTLFPNDSVTCTATLPVAAGEYPGDSEINNTATATGTDPNEDPVEDDSSWTVTVRNILPGTYTTVDKTANPAVVDEPGANVVFTVRVTNGDIFDTLTLNSLIDNVHGNIADASNPGLVDTTCSVPQTINPNSYYECTFTALVDGNAYYVEVDTVTASVTDDDDTSAVIFDDATVTVRPVPPVIDLTKTATPEGVVWPGENVQFDVAIKNDSVATDPVTLDSLMDDVFGDITDLANPAIVSTTCSLVTINPGDTYNCYFIAFIGPVDGTIFGVHEDTVTAIGHDDEGETATAEDDATVTISPPIAVTDSSLCMFDRDLEADGRQFRRLFTPSVPNYKLTATNPGQFFYNLSVSGNDGDTVPITLEVPWAFVTQGARPVHVYDSLSFTTNEHGELCFVPGGEVAAIDEYIVLDDYGVAPDNQGYDPHATVTIQLDIPIPATGFAYVNQHLDDGLKGPHVDVNGDGSYERYQPDANNNAMDPSDLGKTLIPNLAWHEFCTYSGHSTDPDPVDEIGCDSVQNFNEFKRNPGVAGRGAKKVKDEFGNIIPDADPESGEPVMDMWVKLYKPRDPKKGCNAEWCEVGRAKMDQDGYYQIVFKHKGKPTDYRLAIVEDETSDATDLDCENADQRVGLKGNEFEEVNFHGQPDTCKAGPSSLPGGF